MATVKETNLSITIYLHNGDTYNVADENGAKNASAALYDFNARNIVTVIGNGMDTLIPFHSILKIEVTKSTEDKQVDDQFCTTRVPA